MYQCVCYTCNENDILDDLESAQVVFNEHVRREHEVVLTRIEVPLSGQNSEPSDGTMPSEMPERNAEPRDSNPADG